MITNWKGISGIYEVEAKVVKSPVELRLEIYELERRIEAEKQRRAKSKSA